MAVVSAIETKGENQMPRLRKGITNMTPTTTETLTRTVQKTVFDLQSFDDVKLVKTVTLPTKPATIEEALSAVGNDSSALLQVIYDGLCERAVELEKKNPAGFRAVDEDGKAAETDYTGQSADEEQGKLIQGAVLNLAKMNISAQGKDWKSAKAEDKTAAKNSVYSMFRANPAMLATLIPQAAKPVEPTPEPAA